MNLFLGVDGGQSGTTAVIGDQTGRVLPPTIYVTILTSRSS